MRIDSKTQLIDSANESWKQLWVVIEQIDSSLLESRVQLRSSQRAESIKDILAHLIAWHRLFLGWFRTGKNGNPALPAAGFKWDQTPQLNQQLFDQWEQVELDSVTRALKRSHRILLQILDSIDESDLLQPGIYQWTGRLSLAKYIAPNTTSHYKWARQKIAKIHRFLSKPSPIQNQT